MVLIGDIVGDDENAVATAASEVIRLANTRVGEGFVAVSPEARKKFWLDRSRTAAEWVKVLWRLAPKLVKNSGWTAQELLQSPSTQMHLR